MCVARVSTLEKRLADKCAECEELGRQLTRARGLLSAPQVASQGAGQGTGQGKKGEAASAEVLLQLDEVR